MDNILIKTKTGVFKNVAVGNTASSSVLADAEFEVKKDVKLTGERENKVMIEKADEVAVSAFSQQKSIHTNAAVIKKEAVLTPMVQDDKKPVAPAFYFDVKDEEEAQQYQNNKKDELKNNLDKLAGLLAEKIINELALKQGTVNNLSLEDRLRLKKIIISRLRAVRSTLETKEALTKKIDKGGLNFLADEADELVKIIDKEATVLSEIEPNKIQEKIIALDKMFISNILMNTQKSPSEEIKGRPEIRLSEPAISIKPPVIQQSINKMQEIIAPKSKSTEEKIGAPAVDSYFAMRQPSDRKLVGPLEELANISLNEFRVLGRMPKEAVNKIYEKIIILEHDSVEEKVKGIAAWKRSPIYQEYVAVGNEALVSGEEVVAVLQQHQQLSVEEFEAIADLNEQLNF